MKLILIIWLLSISVWGQTQTPIISYNATAQPVFHKRAMVVAQEHQAAEVGRLILEQGGNAVDAAVAVGFALAVTLPRAGNIGGGGFMMIRTASNQKTYALDYRETAPKQSSENMFLGVDGAPDPAKSRHSILSTGVPGTVAGLLQAHDRFGRLTREHVMAPAIRLAKEGIPISTDLHYSLATSQMRLVAHPATSEIFYPYGQVPIIGTIFRQPELAQTLMTISEKGVDGFYSGPIADQMVDYIQAEGGIITRDDLKDYQPKWRRPIIGTYRGYTIASMPPPSSGGIHVVQILNMMESFNIASLGSGSAQSIHVLAESAKRAYRDRSIFLGDSDFVTVPSAKLLSKGYAKNQNIRLNSRTPSRRLKRRNHSARLVRESTETTHFSVVDSDGNAVSNTYTLNFSYGNGRIVPKLGFFLNNEMDDFSASPGARNAYGLMGSHANKIEPEKRMLSSMTPVIVTYDGQLSLVTGTPGGSRIITTMVQIMSNVIDHKMNIAEATIAPRVHHQWYPEKLRVEHHMNQDTRGMLEKMGYTVVEGRAMGSVQSILVDETGLQGFSDLRKPGGGVAGF